MEREAAIASLESLPCVERLSVARLKPSDVIVVECEGILPAEAVRTIENTLRRIWPNNKVVVCDEKTKITIVDGPEDPENPEQSV